MTSTDSMRAEMWLASKLAEFGIFTGITTFDDRKERVRNAILDEDLADVVVGRSNKTHRPVTFGQLFEQVYREKVNQEAKA